MSAISRGLYAAIIILAASGGSAWSMDHDAKDHGAMDHAAMDHGAMKHGESADASPATKAYEKSDMDMHKAMQRAYTGDADRDFLAGMVPHHQGAVDMARIVIQYGKDPEVKKLAQQIIDGQTREIAEMRAMTERLSAGTAAPK